jgi:hypothetical protein
MKIDATSELFRDKKIEYLAVSRLADWRQSAEGSRLLLPPIQRSLVWSNEQIINYWDSLLRGYPAGMMLVHRVKHGGIEISHNGRDANGATRKTNDSDFQLFDGQQRMAAILLGLGNGELNLTRKLWVDLGQDPTVSSGLLFQLRISSTGQPFGYKQSTPNQKIELNKRQTKWDEWLSTDSITTDNARALAFSAVEGDDIIDAKCAISLSEICDKFIRAADADRIISELTQKKGASEVLVRKFITVLSIALNSNVILQEVDAKTVANNDDYIRLFTRLGQGGTRLTDDELTYSIIKHSYPRIHDRMKAIMSETGRIIGEVDLVLAALRVSKTQAPWDGSKVSEMISRPNADFVSYLKDRPQIEDAFVEMIMPEYEEPKLKIALMKLRNKLVYNETTHPKGLPNILLARLPRELVDVLILFSVKCNDNNFELSNSKDIFLAYVLHWLLFVKDNGKASWLAFRHAAYPQWEFSQKSIKILIEDCEREGGAHCLPSRDALCELRNDVRSGNHILRSWIDRFTSVDRNEILKPGDALRALSTNEEVLKRALIWLQREYIFDQWPNYDPTSDRDEDLPIDLDHIVPSGIFGFNWALRNTYLDEDTISSSTDFRWRRHQVGNSIGNYRWLSASDNRRRGKGAYEPLPNNGDIVTNPTDWKIFTLNDPKEGRLWTKEDIALFQKLIDLRTLDLYEALVFESGVDLIVTTRP